MNVSSLDKEARDVLAKGGIGALINLENRRKKIKLDRLERKQRIRRKSNKKVRTEKVTETVAYVKPKLKGSGIISKATKISADTPRKEITITPKNPKYIKVKNRK